MLNEFETVIHNVPVIITMVSETSIDNIDGEVHWLVETKDRVAIGYVIAPNHWFTTDVDYKRYIINEANKLDFDGYKLVDDTNVPDNIQKIYSNVISISLVLMVLFLICI